MAHRYPHSLLVIILSLLGSTLSVTCPQANADRPPVILVMGDSLSAAYQMREQQGWVALLQKRLAAEHLPHRVINASISGETSDGGLSRLAAALEKHQPQIVIIELGANDGLRGLPLQRLQHNLQQMIGLAQTHKAKVLLLGMRLPPNYGPRYTQAFAQIYHTLARQNNIALVPFLLEGVAAQPGMMQSDGLHPNSKAQPQILETVWKKLLPLLTD